MISTRIILLGLLGIYLSTYKAHTAQTLTVRPGRVNRSRQPVRTATPSRGPSNLTREPSNPTREPSNLTREPSNPTREPTQQGHGATSPLPRSRLPMIRQLHPGSRIPSGNHQRRARPNRRRPRANRHVNLTQESVKQKYPWIENPQLDESQASNHSDGLFRFNNPNYLREKFHGLNLDDYTFKAKSGVKTGERKYKVKIEQKWRSIPVYGAGIVVDQGDDTELVLESVDGKFVSGIEQDISSEHPRLSESQAIQLARWHHRDMNNAIENAKTRLVVETSGDVANLVYIVDYFVRESSRAAPEAFRSEPNVVSVRGPFTANARSTLTTDSAVANGFRSQPDRQDENVNEASRRPFTMLDANTGSIIKAWDGLLGLSRHIRSTPNIRPMLVNIVQGNPVYGYRRFEEYMYKDIAADNCYYQIPLGGGFFMRVNDRTTSLTANVIRFPCPVSANSTYDTDRSYGSLSPRNAAYKWGIETINYLKSVTAHVWNWDLNIEVHHPGIIARWTGSKVQLGDGDTYQFYAMSTPDTVAHELGHAFTEYTSGLESHHQSGAMNEAYSDMTAVAFMDEFFQYPAHQVYLIGRLVHRRQKFFRDMCNPRNPNAVRNEGSAPVIVTQSEWTRTTEEHNAASLYNKAFCTLSKTATWNIQLAFKVFALANTVYWKPTETFNSGACGVMKSAYDIRFTQRAVNDVVAAFNVVGITCDDTDWNHLQETR